VPVQGPGQPLGVVPGGAASPAAYTPAAVAGATGKARRMAARAVELGRGFGVPELEMLGLGLEGRALVSEGELEEGEPYLKPVKVKRPALDEKTSPTAGRRFTRA